MVTGVEPAQPTVESTPLPLIEDKVFPASGQFPRFRDY